MKNKKTIKVFGTGQNQTIIEDEVDTTSPDWYL